MTDERQGEETYQDTVGVNVEGDLNLRNTTRCRWDTRKFKLAEQVVVLCSGTFTLVNLDEHTRLVVGVGREGFGFLGWDSGVALDQSSEDTTSGFDTGGKWCDIEKKNFRSLFGSVARENGGLNSGTVGDGFIRVD